MSRPRKDGPSAVESYKLELRDAMSRFLPHQGLPLLTDDGRVRWTSRMLAMTAILMSWSCSCTLLDRFTQARGMLIEVYRTRRRPGASVEGFLRALTGHGQDVLGVLCGHLRQCVGKVASAHWLIEGWPLSKQGRNRRSMPRLLGKVLPPLVLRLIELKDAKGKPVFLLTNVLEPSRLSDNAPAAKAPGTFQKSDRNVRGALPRRAWPQPLKSG